jgi:Exocyst complex component Sec6
MIQLVTIVFKALYEAQKAHRDQFLGDWECCCAGANDFVDMSDKLEAIADEIRSECTLTQSASESLDNVAGALLNLYTTDSVYAAQKVTYFIFKDIYEAEEITPIFFTVEWLDDLPVSFSFSSLTSRYAFSCSVNLNDPTNTAKLQNNELAEDIVKTINDYMEDIEKYMDEIMVQKFVQAMATRFVNYYIELLLQKSPTHKSGSKPFFDDNKRALDRMNGDVELVKDYFLEITDSENKPLREAIDREFDFFETVHEIMAVACGVSHDDIQHYIWAFQTRVKKFAITYAVIGDLYHLVNPSEEKAVYDIMKQMEEDLMDEEDKSPPDPNKAHSTVEGLCLVDMLTKFVESSKEKRVRANESAMKSLFGGWGGGGG